ncbi:SDR family NAD(P)-dependent oxidoreductase [Rhodococcus sp. HNM0563]|uniref:SDR family NAD(P)-dependent oxidoreductase n=1 Tax=unclassified Rhodococcus (in: high G+C Gram-positive bacteria) TaxID=192944 RepID=UPI00146CC37A|nr:MULTISPECIES: SDR family NAD(P)-dependent oxidoreductase [unclassified Rhodococcus (in: high G+C Gram-positive bacteria)]MCK0093337.1 SDR family NAD(P)-dependent oxidoreductase [Rhodococcus sp. F64268]NLU60739.1 SDR family NAD(P)-dependent oxidoreductase [Rhodococcus sp. HNM0563]
MTTDLVDKYGHWGIVVGGSDGIGAAFAHGMARRGMNVVLVARRTTVLEECATEIRARHGVEVRTVALDMSAADAPERLETATVDLEIGLFVYNAGSDDRSTAFLDKDLDTHLSLVHRNCTSVLETTYRFGGPMVARGRGAVVLVTSGAAWVGGPTLATYGATKAFDLILAESLWAEWRSSGVDVLGLVLGATATPSMHRALGTAGETHRDLADPHDVAEEALEHLSDGPTWICGTDNPTGGSPFGAMGRRDAVLALSRSMGVNDK